MHGGYPPVLEKMLQEGMEHPTEFEVSTALALCYFAQKQPDFVSMEVGLGGEIDSTNVVRPLAVALTSIGMDHMDYLGNSLAEITRVKTGIIKQGIPVVTSAEKPEALQIIEKVAEQKGSRLVKVRESEGRNSETQEVVIRRSENGGNVFDYHGLKQVYKSLALGLLGRHQFMNAATALAVCEVLEDAYGFTITEQAVRQGLKEVRWPARLELIYPKPKVLIDGAHNVDGMNTLALALEDYAGSIFKRRRLVLCLGMLSDKEVEKAMDVIVPLADEIFVTKPDSPRAGNWEYPAIVAQKYLAQEKVHMIEDPIMAVREGLKTLGPEDMLLVTGSLYMIAPVRKYLQDGARVY
jgi:dihydrofolate synthase/folylpolyglutamate synthase